MSTFGKTKADVQLWLDRSESNVLGQLVNHGQRRLEDDLRIPPMEFNPPLLTTPVNATHTVASAGGALADATYYYRVSALTEIGETLASTETSVVVSAGTGTAVVYVNWTKVTNASQYKVYGRTTGAEELIATVGDVSTYADDGSITPSGVLPTVNTSRTLAASTNNITIPEDYLEMIYLSLIDPTTEVRSNLVDRSWNKEFTNLVSDVATTNTGEPSFYTYHAITDTDYEWILDKYTDKAYTVDQRYYRRLKTLINDEDSNYWTAKASKALLYATLVESIEYLGDDPRAGAWEKKYAVELITLHKNWSRERVSGQKEAFNSPNRFLYTSKR